jgi:hypothetical protein
MPQGLASDLRFLLNDFSGPVIAIAQMSIPCGLVAGPDPLVSQPAFAVVAVEFELPGIGSDNRIEPSSTRQARATSCP